MQATATRGGRIRLATGLLVALIAMGCSLEVNDLPENTPPEVGEIQMNPPPAELAPTDSFRLSIVAEDLDGDPLTFFWGNNAGNFVGNTLDSVVVWVAPASFAAVDTVQLTVNVRDLAEADLISRELRIPVINRRGDLRVRVYDLAGNPATVPLSIEGVETVTPAVSEYLFEDIDWGDQTVFSHATGAYRGRIDAEPGFAGYPQTLFVLPDIENLLEITVAPNSVLMYPGVDADTIALGSIQDAINLAAEDGQDSVLIRAGNYLLPFQQLPNGGAAALRLEESDLTLAAFPGEGPITIDAAVGGNDFGLHLAGRSTATRVEGLRIVGAAATGLYLNGSSATIADVEVVDCSSAGLFFNGDVGDTLRLSSSVFLDNDHGLSQSGGHLVAENLLLANSRWYGAWLRDGAAGSLESSTIIESALAGLFLADTGNLTVERCIVARGGRGLFLQSGPEPGLFCNLLWSNDHGDYGGVTPGADDLLADPLFCDPLGGDWRVADESPALAADCGPIGAFGDCDSEAP